MAQVQIVENIVTYDSGNTTEKLYKIRYKSGWWPFWRTYFVEVGDGYTSPAQYFSIEGAAEAAQKLDDRLNGGKKKETNLYRPDGSKVRPLRGDWSV